MAAGPRIEAGPNVVTSESTTGEPRASGIRPTWSHLRHVASGLLLLAALAAAAVWWHRRAPAAPSSLASGNGRLEAVEINVAARNSGRILEILVREGDAVAAGQVLARLDPAILTAERHQAEARQRQAQSAVSSTRSLAALRRAERTATAALLTQREVELALAHQRHGRSDLLAESLANSRQEADEDHAREDGAKAAVEAVRAQLAAADAAVAAADAAVLGAESAVEAAAAATERVQADLNELELRSPRDGRVQYLVAQAGETVPAGGRVLNLVDLEDAYLTFFLPTAQAGRLSVGGEARLVLDARPELVFPAVISFVSDVAQFTPKTVETAEERAKLMFRVRARLSPGLPPGPRSQIKAGLPGRAYVRLDDQVPWPPHLRVRLPP